MADNSGKLWTWHTVATHSHSTTKSTTFETAKAHLVGSHHGDLYAGSEFGKSSEIGHAAYVVVAFVAGA